MIYKFVNHEVSPLENHAGGKMYKLHEKLNNRESLTRDEKDSLVFTKHSPVYKLMGYAYDFREYLKEFWVETEFYDIQPVWAMDKTSIRNFGMFGNIYRIVEIKQ